MVFLTVFISLTRGEGGREGERKERERETREKERERETVSERKRERERELLHLDERERERAFTPCAFYRSSFRHCIRHKHFSWVSVTM